MKRLLCLLLILCLPAAAQADVPEQVRAPERLSLPDPIVTSTGKTVITVDAEVIVPAVAGMNVYPVTMRSFAAEEGQALCEALGMDSPSLNWKRYSTAFPDAESLTAQATGPVYTVGLHNTLWRDIPYGGNMTVELSDPPYEYPNAQYRFEPQPFLADESLENSAYTRAEAEALAMKFASLVAPALIPERKGLLPGDHWITGNTDEERRAERAAHAGQIVPDAYMFTFSRQVDGIPVYSISHMDGDRYRPTVLDEWLSIVISDEGLDSLHYWNPCDIGEPIEENVPLLPLEQIVDVARAILPLKAVAEETATINGLSEYYDDREARYAVSRVTLGYMRVLEQDDPTRFRLIPVWDFWGRGEYRLHKVRDGWTDWSGIDLGREDSLITVNAMTGLIIDRDWGY